MGGQLYRDYSKVALLEGWVPYKHHHFNDIIVMLLPYTQKLLAEQIKLCRERMKALDPAVRGSWRRAITTADGCWQIRGYLTPNGSAGMLDYMTKGLLFYGHCCQRGIDIYDYEVVCSCGQCSDEEPMVCEGKRVFAGPYKYTSKAMEADKLYQGFKSIKDDGGHVEGNIQDGDGGSGLCFHLVFPKPNPASADAASQPLSQTLLCGGIC